MEHSLTTATLFWLFVPMPLVLLASIITYFTGRAHFANQKTKGGAR